MEILIMRMDAIGDVVFCLPAVSAIRKHWPDARITFLVGEAASEVVLGHKALDQIIVYPQRLTPSKGILRQRLSVLGRLACGKYDLVIDFHALFRSHALIAWSRDKGGIGYQQNSKLSLGNLFFGTRIPFIDINEHAVSKTLQLIEALGVPAGDAAFHLPLSAEHRAVAAALLSDEEVTDGRPLVAISPVASWQTKCWGKERFAQLADSLISQYGAAVIFTGSPKEAGDVAAAIGMMTGSAVNLAGRTSTLALAAVLERMDVLVCGDTGPGHIAAALGTPVISIFGPTAPWRFRPFGSNHQILWAGLSCSPCFKHHDAECAARHCMQKISVQQVLERVDRVFRDRPVVKDTVKEMPPYV